MCGKLKEKKRILKIKNQKIRKFGTGTPPMPGVVGMAVSERSKACVALAALAYAGVC